MRKHILIVLGIFIVAGAAFYYWASRPDIAKLPADAVTGKRPKITQARYQNFPTIGIAKPVGWGGAKPTAAAGLQVNAFASGLDHPRWIYRLPNGDVLVAETNSPPRQVRGVTDWVMGLFLSQAGANTPSANRITLLRDADGDGVAETKTVLIGGLNSPLGMALTGGYLYIANTDALVRVPFTPGQTKITARPETVVTYPGGGNHWGRGLLAAPDGSSLYVSVGSSSNIAEGEIEPDATIPEEKNRANILQVDSVHKAARVYAGGLRNPQGLAFNPQSGGLWTVVNERDMMGSDLAPDYMTQIELGDHFGWPWYYWGGYPDARVKPQNPALQEYAKRPDYALGAHVAALGLAFANDAKLGPNFANGAFVGEHGSWNRKPLTGYKVVYIPFAADGFPVKGARPVDLLTGFLDANGQARGRPVGVATDKTGGLLVADDVGNVIWRVSAK
ncbi:PQQ-dependent sugar dehydrogenase [Sphingomonas immobilis]|uniref:Sorbosone dehydrogenase family protein n=1 Tax=Sphingomonas immobilis TaxID=3063997 RepID=A0ABT9A1U8_9SPHN|nr:sorbosone dehydrogenase family protein [Sphingomonas sp. CA1-15]MDO7843349.1 sorbosone dehydrogenase family protein [Sphingomonas sp. CA1-15]